MLVGKAVSDPVYPSPAVAQNRADLVPRLHWLGTYDPLLPRAAVIIYRHTHLGYRISDPNREP